MEWYKNKNRISSTSLYDMGDSYITTLQLSAVTSSQAGPFECRTTLKFSVRGLKGYKGKTGILSVTGIHVKDMLCFMISKLCLLNYLKSLLCYM